MFPLIIRSGGKKCHSQYVIRNKHYRDKALQRDHPYSTKCNGKSSESNVLAFYFKRVASLHFIKAIFCITKRYEGIDQRSRFFLSFVCILYKYVSFMHSFALASPSFFAVIFAAFLYFENTKINNCEIWCIYIMKSGYFYAPGSNYRGHIVFVLSVCLYVRLYSTLTFAVTIEPYEIESSYLAYISTNDALSNDTKVVTLTLTLKLKIAFWTLLPLGA